MFPITSLISMSVGDCEIHPAPSAECHVKELFGDHVRERILEISLERWRDRNGILNQRYVQEYVGSVSWLPFEGVGLLARDCVAELARIVLIDGIAD
jgi:hypothetical protein